MFYLILFTTFIVLNLPKCFQFRIPIKIGNYLVIALIFVMISCKEIKPIQGTDLPILELKHYTKMPEIVMKNIQSLSLIKSDDKQKQIVSELKKELSFILNLIVAKNLNSIIDKVHQKDGLWVDLKAHRSHKDILRDIQNPKSYLNVFFINTSALQNQTGDLDKVSVRDVLLITRKIEVDIFSEGEGEYELRLKLVDAPDYSFYLNNPVFRKKQGKWYIYRML